MEGSGFFPLLEQVKRSGLQAACADIGCGRSDSEALSAAGVSLGGSGVGFYPGRL